MATPPELRAPRQPADWDQRFLLLARQIAGWSKDPSIKVGALAVRERRILATGYNGLPAGVLDSEERLVNRELKYEMTVHAEANLIAFAARAGTCLMGSTVYVWPLMTCGRCAAKLIQSGIGAVVVPDVQEPMRWAESFRLARVMFNEAGISVTRIPWQTSGGADQEHP
jgi:dCMP deaminase